MRKFFVRAPNSLKIHSKTDLEEQVELPRIHKLLAILRRLRHGTG
jgi:hypothetical protein